MLFLWTGDLPVASDLIEQLISAESHLFQRNRERPTASVASACPVQGRGRPTDQ
jgi:hypothetical protein